MDGVNDPAEDVNGDSAFNTLDCRGPAGPGLDRPGFVVTTLDNTVGGGRYSSVAIGVDAGSPSLDGLRYLNETRPGEYRAVLWLRREVRGTPVLLEAQGDPYQDFSRISMLTGLPTVLGWEHHVKQRGNSEEEIAERRDAIRRLLEAAARLNEP